MTPAEIVAQAYGLDASDVERWTDATVEVFARNAQRRGWLVAS